MKTVFSILSFSSVVLMLWLGTFRAIATAAEAQGLVAGLLAKCPNKPNCVCSEQKDDASHYITPIVIHQLSTVDALALLKKSILEMGGTLQVERDNYLAATFTSAIFKFVDDLEIRIDSTRKVIHIRSASRVGYSDMGVNKKRADLLKKLFDNKVTGADKPLNAPP